MSHEHLEKILIGVAQLDKPSSSTESLLDPKSKVLCQTIARNFNKTPTGKIYEVDLKDMFALMILQLNLRPNGAEKKFLLSKPSPFCFTIDQALAVLECLNYNIENSVTVISLSYTINKTVGFTSIEKFFNAKLLHCPGDRTRARPKAGVTLQPTPKGVAVIKQFIFSKGIKFSTIPPILVSSLNSMDLFYFDRNYLNDKIIYSSYLVKILFIRMFGYKPNVWSPTNKPEKFTINYDMVCWTGQIDITTFAPHEFISPLHHKYFTNPESDSHVQYSAASGVRLLARLEGGIKHYCVSGKAIVQWLMDCTDILSVKSAVEVGSLFLSQGLLVLEPHLPHKLSDKLVSECYYTITDLARGLLLWKLSRSSKPYNQAKIHSNQAEIHLGQGHHLGQGLHSGQSPRQGPRQGPRPADDLTQFLSDPGLKHLFRTHLTREFCSENIDAYGQLQLFLKKFGLLSKLLSYKDGLGHKQLLKFSNDCLALAYHIYFTYLSPKATFVLNIDYNLRTKTTLILIDNADSSVIKASDIYNYYYESDGTPTSVASDSFGENGFETGAGTAGTAGTSAGTSTSSSPSTIPSTSGDSSTSPSTAGTISGTISGTGNRLSDGQIKSHSVPDTVPDDDSSVFSGSHSSRRPSTAATTEFDAVYSSLLEFAPVASELMGRLFRLMEVDSFPKFLESDLYADYKQVIPNSLLDRSS